MKKIRFLIILFYSLSLSLIFSGQSIASELDSFSQLDHPLLDSKAKINLFTNQELEKVINFVNSYSNTCNEDSLYRAIKHHFAARPQNTFRRFIIQSEAIDQRRLKINQSVFKNLTFIDSFVVGGLSRLFNLTGYEVRMDQYNIGSDKFAHFFNKGWKYYQRYYRKNWPIEKVLTSGFKQEIGLYGFTTTGIASFSDLSANFSGLRFWNHVLGNYPDILNPTKTITPLISCQNNQWVQAKPFNWMDYINASWDETYNCSLFRNKFIYQKFKNNLEKLNLRHQCPINQKKITKIYQQYQPFSDYLINQTGHNYWEKVEEKYLPLLDKK